MERSDSFSSGEKTAESAHYLAGYDVQWNAIRNLIFQKFFAHDMVVGYKLLQAGQATSPFASRW